MTAPAIAALRSARKVTVGVIGDVILDRYLRGETERISPEAPIPVLDVVSEDLRIGGAGNVVANLLAAEAGAWIAGVVGDDANGRLLADLLADAGADVGGLVADASRPTIQKTRLIARSQQVLRYDREDRRPLDAAAERRLVEAISARARACDLLVLSDYAKGTLTPAVIAAALASGRRVLVDPKGSDYARYRGAYAITPNRAEAEAATKIEIRDAAGLEHAADRLFEVTQASVVLITLGAGGIYCAAKDGARFHVHTEARKVFDVTGAGDTVIALLARYLAADVPLETAVRIANSGAGIVVGKLGAGTVAPAELARAMGDAFSALEEKILPRARAAELGRELRAQALRVVFTNGCFDLLHAGHARYLAHARSLGDVLIVGLNDDASVRRLKGPSRPLVSWDDRAALLAALAPVDAVLPFAEDTPEALIRELAPDVLVKGADWQGKEIAGARFIESRGGRVAFAPLLEGRSTTGLVERIERGREA